MSGPIHYVIGDIHGEIHLLKHLHSSIRKYHQRRFQKRNKIIVHLGDYVDRGLDSFAVIEFIMKLTANPPDRTRLINLKGNHELMMIKAFQSRESENFQHWIRNGGQETIESYALRGFSKPPQYHLDWIDTLPSFYRDIENKLICVHAGVNVNTFPHDGEKFHLWTRSTEFLDSENWNNPNLSDMTIVHGHTPTANFEPEMSKTRNRINIDTGACYGGVLTAAVLIRGQLIDFVAV